MSSTLKPFATDADLETARTLAEKFAVSGVHVRAIGKEVLASLDLGGLPMSSYAKLARMCRNQNVDHKRNVQLAKELSTSLFGCIISNPTDGS